MKETALILFLFLIFFNKSNGQVIAPVTSPELAKIKVCIVKDLNAADLKVFLVAKENLTGKNDGLWFISEKPDQTKYTIFWTTNPQEAGLKIILVANNKEAGWINRSKKYLLN